MTSKETRRTIRDPVNPDKANPLGGETFDFLSWGCHLASGAFNYTARGHSDIWPFTTIPAMILESDYRRLHYLN